MDTDDLNQLIRSLNQGAASDRREAGAPELELVRPEEPSPDLELTAKTPPTGEAELAPELVALLSETVRRGATDLLLVPGAPPVVRVNGSLEKAGGGEAVSAQTAFDLLSPSLSADRRRRYHETGVVDISLRFAGGRAPA